MIKHPRKKKFKNGLHTLQPATSRWLMPTYILRTLGIHLDTFYVWYTLVQKGPSNTEEPSHLAHRPHNVLHSRARASAKAWIGAYLPFRIEGRMSCPSINAGYCRF